MPDDSELLADPASFAIFSANAKLRIVFVEREGLAVTLCKALFVPGNHDRGPALRIEFFGLPARDFLTRAEQPFLGGWLALDKSPLEGEIGTHFGDAPMVLLAEPKLSLHLLALTDLGPECFVSLFARRLAFLQSQQNDLNATNCKRSETECGREQDEVAKPPADCSRFDNPARHTRHQVHRPDQKAKGGACKRNQEGRAQPEDQTRQQDRNHHRCVGDVDRAFGGQRGGFSRE